MNNYNESTKNINIEVKLIEKNENFEESIWEVKTSEPFIRESDSEYNLLPEGTTFKYRGELEDTAEDVEEYIKSNGILSACNISNASFEQLFVEGE